MAEQSRQLTIRRYGDRWAIAVGDEVVLVSPSRRAAENVVATANEVLEQSGIDPERRSFGED
ncbi:hypothetical protein [Caulobacter segnis]|uniref:hypothetical protein n=1 Tax=Caulobacter segnis TaxID=88688 RepID=UPI001CC0975E|nr:hypothetical protein [Caulobacter segnis]UAL09831.1 hypothetical protein K8940_18940 [Caulobacter segnis]